MRQINTGTVTCAEIALCSICSCQSAGSNAEGVYMWMMQEHQLCGQHPELCCKFHHRGVEQNLPGTRRRRVRVTVASRHKQEANSRDEKCKLRRAFVARTYVRCRRRRALALARRMHRPNRGLHTRAVKPLQRLSRAPVPNPRGREPRAASRRTRSPPSPARDSERARGLQNRATAKKRVSLYLQEVQVNFKTRVPLLMATSSSE